jgi:hypothetical protein
MNTDERLQEGVRIECTHNFDSLNVEEALLMYQMIWGVDMPREVSHSFQLQESMQGERDSSR